jgi:hypothetical protein
MRFDGGRGVCIRGTEGWKDLLSVPRMKTTQLKFMLACKTYDSLFFATVNILFFLKCFPITGYIV